MTDAPERIWAVCDVDVSAQTCDVYAQDTPDGFVDPPTEYVRIDIHREALMQMIASSGQAQDAYIAQGSAEAERDALAARVKELKEAEEALKTQIIEFERNAKEWYDRHN